MKNNRYQNYFLGFGLVVLAIMLTQLDYAEVWRGVGQAGYWFLAVVVLWAFLYVFNTATWWLIIKGVQTPRRNEKVPDSQTQSVLRVRRLRL